MVRRNGWKKMRDEIIEMQRTVARILERRGIDDPPPEIKQLQQNLAATRRTLESLWTKQ